MTEWYKVDKIEIAHEDVRRMIICPFNGDFVARQVKELRLKKGSILGNHYHNYRELFFISKGRAIFYLENITNKETAIVKLKGGDRLIIEPKVAHKARMWKSTRTVEATEEPYISAENNDVRYELDWANI